MGRMTFIVLVFSVLGYLLFLFVYSHMSSFFISFYGTSSHMYNRIVFWLCCLVAPAAALSLDFALEGFRRMGVPMPYMVIQEMMKGYGHAGMLGKGMLGAYGAPDESGGRKDTSDRMD